MLSFFITRIAFPIFILFFLSGPLYSIAFPFPNLECPYFFPLTRSFNLSWNFAKIMTIRIFSVLINSSVKVFPANQAFSLQSFLPRRTTLDAMNFLGIAFLVAFYTISRIVYGFPQSELFSIFLFHLF